MSREKPVTPHAIEIACDEVQHRDWMHGVQAKVAARLGVSESTIYRRFKKQPGGLRRAIVEWVLDSEGHPGNDWAERLAATAIAKMEQADTVAEGFAEAIRYNWELISSDNRMHMQMFLWSNIGVDEHLRVRVKAHYDAYDQINRNLWQEILTYLRTHSGKRISHRPGLTESQFVVIVDGLAEGLVLRHHADPSVVTADMYAQAVTALAASVLDYDIDLRSIEQQFDDQLGSV